MVEWLGLHTSTAGDLGLIPGWGTKIPQDMWRGQKKKKNSPQKEEFRQLFVLVLCFSSVVSILVFFYSKNLTSYQLNKAQVTLFLKTNEAKHY